jgi:methylenetetrahydrofolate dehydrogenase (NADP+) / methenyltetrahydrofolate cyclohydrolase
MIEISGKEIASKIYSRLSGKKTDDLKLSVLMAGDDPAISSFARQKERAAQRVGISFELINLSDKSSTQDILSELDRLFLDKSVTAIVVQLPLPGHINKDEVLKAIPPNKDVDALNSKNVISPAAGAVMEIVNEFFNRDLSGADAVIVGYGGLVGKPVYSVLKDRVNSITILDKGDDISRGVSEADIIVLGTGVPGIVSSKMVKEGALVIDFGYGAGNDGKVKGDFELLSGDIEKNIAYTPTPGGTGPILVAKLFENAVQILDMDCTNEVDLCG